MSEEKQENSKQIIINGTNNRYLIKRANRVKTVPKTRSIINKYNLSMDELNFDKQLFLLNEIYNKVGENNKEKDIIVKEIINKINSYKQQDLLKKHFDENKFITYDILVEKIIEENMKCYYCSCEMFILYENVRELSQWTVDRIDNTIGHNKDNFVLSCLNCNIKRRNRSSAKFLFSQQIFITSKLSQRLEVLKPKLKDSGFLLSIQSKVLSSKMSFRPNSLDVSK
jgi:hypothetical protein